MATRKPSPTKGKCAFCESEGRLDFHHWDYDRDIGINICRVCHNYIHEGKRARVQTSEAPKGEDWKVAVINRTVGLHEQLNGRSDSWADFFTRYNIPHDIKAYDDVKDLEL